MDAIEESVRKYDAEQLGAKRQHKKPCARCPFRRASLRGWLGGLSPDEFKHNANMDIRMPCHSHLPDGVDYEAAQKRGTPENSAPQCAGRAIHWANQFKRARGPGILELPQDNETVFSWPHEFLAHHKRERP